MFSMRAVVIALALAGALAGSACSPLGVLSATTLSDAQQTTAEAYGTQPRQTLDVYVPNPRIENADVVVFLYGGRWQFGSKDQYRFVAASLAARGFITVIPDYRLFPQVDWRDFVSDAATALRWVETHIAAYGGNPRRIFLMGHSAGAHIGAMVSLDAVVRAQAGLERAPCGFVGVAGPYDFLPIQDADVKEVFKSADPLIESQPIHYVDQHAPPMLLLTGADDVTVKPGNSVRLAAAVNQQGGHAGVISYPDVGHVSIMLALAPQLRFLAPTLRDTADFVRGLECGGG